MSSEMLQMLGTYVSVLAAVQARLGTDPAAAALFNRGVTAGTPTAPMGAVIADRAAFFCWLLIQML